MQLYGTIEQSYTILVPRNACRIILCSWSIMYRLRTEKVQRKINQLAANTTWQVSYGLGPEYEAT